MDSRSRGVLDSALMTYCPCDPLSRIPLWREKTAFYVNRSEWNQLVVVLLGKLRWGTWLSTLPIRMSRNRKEEPERDPSEGDGWRHQG